MASRRPTLEDIVARAEALVPRLRERASETEALRRPLEQTIQDFLENGLFRVFQPARWGGYELDYGRTQTQLSNVIGRACGSSAWVQCVIACHAWCLGMFPEEAQQAVWGRDPDTLVASAFSFKTGRGRPADGGYFISGDWQFSSGSSACQWVILACPMYADDAAAQPMKTLWCVVPRQKWELLDTWYAAGLKGSGSSDVRVAGAFVPTEFTVNTAEFDGRPTPGSALNPSYIYRLPLHPVFPFNVSTPALGIARGAIEAYVAYLGSRPDRARMVQRQLRLAQSAVEVDAAEAVWLSKAALLERLGPAGGPWPAATIFSLRRDLAYATRLCARAVDRLALAVGAHGIQDDHPLQRAWRDVHAVANHAGNNWDMHAVTWGQAALGLPPASPR